MKVIHVTAIDTTLAILLSAQLRALKAAGHEVHTVSTGGPMLAALREDGITCHEVTIPRSASPLRIWKATRQLQALFAREQYDVVHVHTPVASVAARIAAHRAQVPHVLYTAHGFYFHDNMRPLPYRVHTGIERRMGRLTSHLLVQSREDYITAVELGISSAANTTYLGNGVDEALFSRDQAASLRESVRAELGYTERDIVFAYVGRLVGEKGVGELVAAVEVLHASGFPVRCLIVGSNVVGDRDTFGRSITDRIASEHLRGCFHATGFTRDVPRYLAAADAFVLPSYREGLPRSIIEAMHLGLPVISTDIRGPREEVIDGVTGYLVPAKNAAALAGAMERVVMDPAQARRMGEVGCQRAARLFCEHQVVERLLAVYGRLAR
jgi:glycosyltransferase involved in cell wall biosynthesis